MAQAGVRAEDRIMPLPMYEVQFLEPAQLPRICGKALEQKIWVLLCLPGKDMNKTAIKRLETQLKSAMDYLRYYDPFWKVRPATVKVFWDNKRMQIVLDTVGSRQMRSELFKYLQLLDCHVFMVILSKLDETVMYGLPVPTDDNYWHLAEDLVMGTYQERKQYKIATESYKELKMRNTEPVLTVTAHSSPVYSKRL